MSNPPRDHHFIPQFYQQKWAGNDGRVERYTRTANGNIHCARHFPSAVAYQQDLYRHPRATMGEWNAQALEWAIFARIDDAAAKALNALLSDRSALRDNNVRGDWSIFLRSMLLRTPYQMAGTLASLERIWRDTDVSAKYASMRKPGMPASATEYLESLNPNEAKESAFRLFADALGMDATTRHMMQLPWRIFDCSAADHRLLLSDHPVVLVPLATEEGHVAMPLSPTRFLIAASNDRMKAVADSLPPKLAVRILNKLTVQRAQHYVIAQDRTQDYFIRKQFGADPIPPFLSPTKL
jgi:hypothetical protein